MGHEWRELPLNAHHLDITKYKDSDDRNYKTVRDVIQSMIEDIIQKKDGYKPLLSTNQN
jgi:hypothetical protein